MSQSSSPHAPRSIFEKIWAAHLVKTLDDGRDLIFITRHVLQETTSAPAFEKLRKAGRAVRHPELTVATQDHIVSTEPNRDEATNPGGLELLRLMRANAYASRIRHFGVDDPRQGIVHVIGPELGLALPGCILTCGDSHTSTVGGLGALGIGVGTSEVEHVLATQTLALTRPRTMRITFNGPLPAGVGAKDVILHAIGELGIAAAQGCAVEYAGDADPGVLGRAAADALQHVDRDRRAAGAGRSRRRHLRLCPRPRVRADRRPAGPGDCRLAQAADRPRHPVRSRFRGRLPQPRAAGHLGHHPAGCRRRRPMHPRSRLLCNRAAARAGRRRHQLHGPGTRHARWTASPSTSPSSARAPIPASAISRPPPLSYADARWHRAYAPWSFLDRCPSSAPPRPRACTTCSAPPASNGAMRAARCASASTRTWSPPGARCIATSNRNFEHRQGPRSRTHLASPAMTAAAAIAGTITDSRRMTPA